MSFESADIGGTSPIRNRSNVMVDDELDEVMGRHGTGGNLSPTNTLLRGSIGPFGRSANANDGEEDLLFDGIDASVTELDLAAYGKGEFTLNMQKNIMKRMYNAFDMQHTGHITIDELGNLLNYLGRPVERSDAATKTLTDLAEQEALTFDAFWNWWLDFDAAPQAFETVSFDFRMPFHQQQLQTTESGEKYTPAYRIAYQFKDVETGEVKPISPWHDIPLEVRDIVRTTPESIRSNKFNFICEIPKWTRAKFEICTKEKFNPIKQDIKNGVPRFYQHGDMMWNYGAFPQTWESTAMEFVDGVKGDNDPVDAIEIGMVQMKTGAVSQVKVLGILGMIDDGEMDWKVICISHKDPVAKFLKDIHDVPKFLPGCLDSIREWLRAYKICQGGKENKFAFDGEYKDKEYAIQVLDESHRMWANLKKINRTEQV